MPSFSIPGAADTSMLRPAQNAMKTNRPHTLQSMFLRKLLPRKTPRNFWGTTGIKKHFDRLVKLSTSDGMDDDASYFDALIHSIFIWFGRRAWAQLTFWAL